MATSDYVIYSTRQAALATIFENSVAPQLNRSAPLLQLLPKIKGDGKNVSWAYSTGTAVPTTAAVADGADIADFLSDTKSNAYLDYAIYSDTFGVGGLAEAAASAAGNPAQLADLIGDEMNDSNMRLGAAIGYDIYWGTGSSNTMLGLIDPTNGALTDAGTYAGVARSGVDSWKSNVVDCKKGRLTVAKVRELQRAIYTKSGQNVDFFVTTPIVFDQIADTMQAQRRFVQEVNLMSRGVIRLDGGYTMIDIDGIPVFKDVRLATTASATSGRLLGINARETRIRYLPTPTASQILRQAGVKVGAETQNASEATGLMGKVIEHGKKGDKTTYQTVVYLTVQCRRPNANGMIYDINELAG